MRLARCISFRVNAISNIAAFQRRAETVARVKEGERLWDRFETFSTKAGT
jgi:hypothetical protein